MSLSARAGVVYLVGSGPGDPGLMTVRGRDLLASADVVAHDRLTPPGFLAGVREDAIVLDVGKASGHDGLDATAAQRGIEDVLIEHARAGRSVVRLKGGDPFVFGRGGEEAEALASAGVPFEVVPGVTAGVAVPAYAGIPVTHRDDSSAVAFVTGHEDPAKAETALDWDALARFPGTLVLYMGVRNLTEIAARLVAAGRDSAEPATVIQSGTLPQQRSVVAPLGEVAGEAEKAGIQAPAIILVGDVARHAETLAWLEDRPLHGTSVVVTRARAQASELAARLTELGAEVIELPAIRIVPTLDTPEVVDAVASLHAYALVCFTSASSVALLFEAMAARGLDARALAAATVAAIGEATAGALRDRGVIADVVAERSVAESLIEALEPVDVAGKPVLLPRAKSGRDELPDALRSRGAELDVVTLYENVAEEVSVEQAEAAASADYVTFTSSSTVRNLVEALGERFPASARIVSIGPVTSRTAREAGLEVHAEAERHDLDGLVTALLEDAARG
jgi:uroporphyrinogen III methyltransferase / synthase